MRIIFMGNPKFAVPSLEKIAQSNHDVLYVISNPPKKIGRGRKIKETAVGISAKAMEIPVIQPTNLNEIEFLRYITSMQPDIFVVVAYKILPTRLLSIPRLGAINLHPSKLPQYRGAAPIQWSLINGDKKTAVTTIKLSKEVDSGAIMMQEELKISTEDNFGSLSARLSDIGANLVVKTLDGIENGTLICQEQDNSKMTLAPKIRSDDLRITWAKTANEINNQIRAFSPSPGAFTILNGKRLKIYSATIQNDLVDDRKIGEITVSDNEVSVQTGTGQLSLNNVQLEGKKRMSIADFLRGVTITPNSIIGS